MNRATSCATPRAPSAKVSGGGGAARPDLNAAKIAGADARVDRSKRARSPTCVVTTGDLFDDGAQIRHVFIDGRPIVLDDRPSRSAVEGGATEIQK